MRSGSLAGGRNTVRGSPNERLAISATSITVVLQLFEAVVLGAYQSSVPVNIGNYGPLILSLLGQGT